MWERWGLGQQSLVCTNKETNGQCTQGQFMNILNSLFCDTLFKYPTLKMAAYSCHTIHVLLICLWNIA